MSLQMAGPKGLKDSCGLSELSQEWGARFGQFLQTSLNKEVRPFSLGDNPENPYPLNLGGEDFTPQM